jgi:hypothetical protein
VPGADAPAHPSPVPDRQNYVGRHRAAGPDRAKPTGQ